MLIVCILKAIERSFFMNWYLQDNKDSDVVTSTRIRLARNLNGFKFNLSKKEEIEELEKKIQDNLMGIGYGLRFFKLKDMDDMTEAERKAMYDKSSAWIQELMDAGESTDEPDDDTGKIIYSATALKNKENYADSDTLTSACRTVQYGLPYGYLRKDDSDPDSVYYESDSGKTYLYIAIKDYSALLTDDESLKEYVDSYAKNDHAMPQDCGSKEMDGRVFYYYSYFTQNWCDDGSVIVEYNFKAYCDIGEGQIYTISAHSYTNSDVMDTDTYLECMKLNIKLNIK